MTIYEVASEYQVLSDAYVAVSVYMLTIYVIAGHGRCVWCNMLFYLGWGFVIALTGYTAWFKYSIGELWNF